MARLEEERISYSLDQYSNTCLYDVKIELWTRKFRNEKKLLPSFAIKLFGDAISTISNIPGVCSSSKLFFEWTVSDWFWYLDSSDTMTNSAANLAFLNDELTCSPSNTKSNSVEFSECNRWGKSTPWSTLAKHFNCSSTKENLKFNFHWIINFLLLPILTFNDTLPSPKKYELSPVTVTSTSCTDLWNWFLVHVMLRVS